MTIAGKPGKRGCDDNSHAAAEQHPFGGLARDCRQLEAAREALLGRRAHEPRSHVERDTVTLLGGVRILLARISTRPGSIASYPPYQIPVPARPCQRSGHGHDQNEQRNEDRAQTAGERPAHRVHCR